MSRFFGSIWFTTLPPNLSVPEVMSSSPATMRSAVVLPHPDGPTSTMNSPSAMLSDNPSTALMSSPNTLVTPSKVISAMRYCSLWSCG